MATWVTYEITPEPIYDRKFRRLPRHTRDNIEQLYAQAQKQPLKAIPVLLELIEVHPDIPQLYNYR